MTHKSVLLNEVLNMLDPKPGQIYIDGTANGGGHTFAILERVKPSGKILAIDKDRDLIEQLQADEVIPVCGNYGDIKKIAQDHGFHQVSGVLLDLGYSSYHIESSGRGFSFLRGEPLIMRYETETDLGTGLTAQDVVNRFSADELADVIFKYGEERYARRIAKQIVFFRQKEKIVSSKQLAEIIKEAYPKKAFWRIHPATKTFQALRIFVNRELEELERALPQALDLLEEGGKLAVISFHSLEDRIVKNFFKQKEKEGLAKNLTRKPICPSAEEIIQNPRARSAKFRAVQKSETP